MVEECDENDYHLDLDSYKPVQPITIDHGVALFPVAAPHCGMDLHLLQVNMRFTYVALWGEIAGDLRTMRPLRYSFSFYIFPSCTLSFHCATFLHDFTDH